MGNTQAVDLLMAFVVAASRQPTASNRVLRTKCETSYVATIRQCSIKGVMCISTCTCISNTKVKFRWRGNAKSYEADEKGIENNDASHFEIELGVCLRPCYAVTDTRRLAFTYNIGDRGVS